MVKTAKDYPIFMAYGSTEPPYSEYQPHHGEDRACPTGTPIVVGKLKIGLVGSTGFSTGPHLHTDKSRTVFGIKRYFNPKGWSTLKGKVVFVGNMGSAGNTVIIRTLLGTEYRFLHLSKIVTSVGKKTH